MKYAVTVWKTETFSTVIEVEAPNKDEAMVEAENIACNCETEEDVRWDYSESFIEADRVEEVK